MSMRPNLFDIYLKTGCEEGVEAVVTATLLHVAKMLRERAEEYEAKSEGAGLFGDTYMGKARVIRDIAAELEKAAKEQHD